MSQHFIDFHNRRVDINNSIASRPVARNLLLRGQTWAMGGGGHKNEYSEREQLWLT
jgi:hypothetical protein